MAFLRIMIPQVIPTNLDKIQKKSNFFRETFPHMLRFDEWRHCCYQQFSGYVTIKMFPLIFACAFLGFCSTGKQKANPLKYENHLFLWPPINLGFIDVRI